VTSTVVPFAPITVLSCTILTTPLVVEKFG